MEVLLCQRVRPGPQACRGLVSSRRYAFPVSPRALGSARSPIGTMGWLTAGPRRCCQACQCQAAVLQQHLASAEASCRNLQCRPANARKQLIRARQCSAAAQAAGAASAEALQGGRRGGGRGRAGGRGGGAAAAGASGRDGGGERGGGRGEGQGGGEPGRAAGGQPGGGDG